MSSDTFLFVMLGCLLFEFGLTQGLAWRNRRASRNSVPDVLEGVYDALRYDEQQRYFRANGRLALQEESFSFALTFLLLMAGVFGWLYDALAGRADALWATLIFFGLLALASDLLALPFSIRRTFGIEARFGFNKTTPRTFATDRFKGLLLGGVLGGVLLGAVFGFYGWLGEWFWFFAFLLFALFTVLLNRFYARWIVPLFNRQKPLEEGALRDAIETFCRKHDFSVREVYVIDGSRRSTKANAYFAGMGRKRRIVLYDTLVADLTEEEVLAVLAHEMGHCKCGHVRSMLGASLLNMLLLFFLFSRLTESALPAAALGSSSGVPVFALSLFAFALLYTPLGIVTGLLLNALSRRHEYQADAFAVACGLGGPLARALKRLASASLTNLTPDDWYVRFYYSHPTLRQRVERLCGGDALKKE